MNNGSTASPNENEKGEPLPSPHAFPLLAVIAAWAISLLLFYWFGLWGPMGRYTLVFQIGLPGYLTYRYYRSRRSSLANDANR